MSNLREKGQELVNFLHNFVESAGQEISDAFGATNAASGGVGGRSGTITATRPTESSEEADLRATIDFLFTSHAASYHHVLQPFYALMIRFFRDPDEKYRNFCMQCVPAIIWHYVEVSTMNPKQLANTDVPETLRRKLYGIAELPGMDGAIGSAAADLRGAKASLEALILEIYNFYVCDCDGNPLCDNLTIPSLAIPSVYHDSSSFASFTLTGGAASSKMESEMRTLSRQFAIGPQEHIHLGNRWKILRTILKVFNVDMANNTKHAVEAFLRLAANITTSGFAPGTFALVSTAPKVISDDLSSQANLIAASGGGASAHLERTYTGGASTPPPETVVALENNKNNNKKDADASAAAAAAAATESAAGTSQVPFSTAPITNPNPIVDADADDDPKNVVVDDGDDIDDAGIEENYYSIEEQKQPTVPLHQTNSSSANSPTPLYVRSQTTAPNNNNNRAHTVRESRQISNNNNARSSEQSIINNNAGGATPTRQPRQRNNSIRVLKEKLQRSSSGRGGGGAGAGNEASMTVTTKTTTTTNPTTLTGHASQEMRRGSVLQTGAKKFLETLGGGGGSHNNNNSSAVEGGGKNETASTSAAPPAAPMPVTAVASGPSLQGIGRHRVRIHAPAEFHLELLYGLYCIGVNYLYNAASKHRKANVREHDKIVSITSAELMQAIRVRATMEMQPSAQMTASSAYRLWAWQYAKLVRQSPEISFSISSNAAAGGREMSIGVGSGMYGGSLPAFNMLFGMPLDVVADQQQQLLQPQQHRAASAMLSGNNATTTERESKDVRRGGAKSTANVGGGGGGSHHRDTSPFSYTRNQMKNAAKELFSLNKSSGNKQQQQRSDQQQQEESSPGNKKEKRSTKHGSKSKSKFAIGGGGAERTLSESNMMTTAGGVASSVVANNDAVLAELTARTLTTTSAAANAAQQTAVVASAAANAAGGENIQLMPMETQQQQQQNILPAKARNKSVQLLLPPQLQQDSLSAATTTTTASSIPKLVSFASDPTGGRSVDVSNSMPPSLIINNSTTAAASGAATIATTRPQLRVIPEQNSPSPTSLVDNSSNTFNDNNNNNNYAVDSSTTPLPPPAIIGNGRPIRMHSNSVLNSAVSTSESPTNANNDEPGGSTVDRGRKKSLQHRPESLPLLSEKSNSNATSAAGIRRVDTLTSGSDENGSPNNTTTPLLIMPPPASSSFDVGGGGGVSAAYQTLTSPSSDDDDAAPNNNNNNNINSGKTKMQY